MAQTHFREEREALQKVFASLGGSRYSDLTIKCGDDTHHVHRAHVCTKSKFFEKACDGPFVESQTKVVTLPDDDPETVIVMLYFVYEGADKAKGLMRHYMKRLSPECRSDSSDNPNLGICLFPMVYALAEKYGLEDLKRVAAEGFEEWGWYEVLGSDTKFAGACEIVYTTTIETDRRLRDIVSHILHCRPVALDRKPIQDLLKTIPEVAYDLVMYARNLGKPNNLNGKKRKKETA